MRFGCGASLLCHRTDVMGLDLLEQCRTGLCVVSSAHSLVFQRYNLQDKSISILAASLWLQVEFVGNGPMATEWGQGRGKRNTSC